MRNWIRGLWGTVGTWLNFAKGPCLYIALAAAALGGWGAASLTYKLQERKVLAERLTTTQMRADIAQTRADVLADATVLQQQVHENTLAAIQRAAEALSGEIAQSRDREALAALDRSIQALHADVRYACRREPLPDTYIEGLRLPRQPL